MNVSLSFFVDNFLYLLAILTYFCVTADHEESYISVLVITFWILLAFFGVHLILLEIVDWLWEKESKKKNKKTLLQRLYVVSNMHMKRVLLESFGRVIDKFFVIFPIYISHMTFSVGYTDFLYVEALAVNSNRRVNSIEV